MERWSTVLARRLWRVATNATRVVGFLGYLFVHDLATLIAVALLVSVSDRLFWVAQPTLIGEVRRLGSRDRWFGLTVALRAAGLGLGGLLAGLAVSSLGIVGYHALTVGNAVSFALATLLIASLRTRSELSCVASFVKRAAKASGRSWLIGPIAGSSQATWCSGSQGR